MTAKEKIALLTSVESDISDIVNMIAEFNSAGDLKSFSLKHFGNDGEWAMYNDRHHVSNVLERMLNDINTSDRVKALKAMGCEPCNV